MPDQLTSGPSLSGRGELATLLRGFVKANLIHHLAHMGGRGLLMRIGRAYRPPQDWLPVPGGDGSVSAELERELLRVCAIPTASLSEDAFAGLRKLAVEESDPLWAWIGLGLNYLRLWTPGSFAKSLECFEAVVRLRPDWAWSYLLRGEAKRSLLDYAGALADYDEALAREPKLAWAVAFKARVLFQSRTDPRDLAVMRRAVALAPGEGWMRSWLAESYRRLNKGTLAVAEFRRALRLDPLYDQAYTWRAKLLLSQGRAREAIASLRTGIRLCPSFEKAYRPLVRALRATGQTGKAIEALETAAVLNHRNDWLGNWRVEGAADDGPARAALMELDLFLERRPGNARALAWRAETLVQLGRFDEGLRDLDAALGLSAKLAWAHAWRGEALLKAGRGEEAAAALDRAVALDPSYGRSWMWRGRVKALRGDWAAALADFEAAAAARRVEYSWLDAWRGQALFELGRAEEALKHLDCAVLLDRNAKLFYAWRAKARLKTGDRGGAREDLLRACGDGALPWAMLADAEELRRRGRRAESSRLLGEIITRHGRAQPWLYLLRYRARKEGLLPRAARDVDLAFRKDHRSGWLFGLDERPAGVPAEAENLRDAQFAARPECAAVLAYRGQAELARGRAEGLADLERAASLERAGWIVAWLGEAKRKAGRLEEAIRDLTEAARLDPNYDSAYAWRGTALLQRGDAAGARADLDRAIARRPTARALLDRSRALRKLGELDAALADLERAARLNPELGWEQATPEGLKRSLEELEAPARREPRFLAWRGEALSRAGRPGEALCALDEALVRAPKLAWAHAWRAEALLKLGQVQDARLAAKRAVRLDPKYARAQAAAAEAALASSEPKEALAFAAKAARLYPYSARLRVLKARAAVALGRLSAARAELQRSLALCPGYAEAASLLGDISGTPAAQDSGALEFFVNYACNAKCPFCFNPPDATPELERGLAFDELARRMYAGRAQGFRSIKFIGGEVTIREDLPKILGLARRIGFKGIQVTTNGIRLADGDYARKLVRLGADSFRFSIHGHTPVLHDRLVAVPGALEKIRKAVGHLRPLGVRLGINYVLNRLNYQELPETLQFFYDELGISDVIVYFLRYQGFGALPANKALLQLKMSEAVPYVREALRRLKDDGRSPLPALIHFPPCAIPELAENMLDWTVDPEGAGRGNTARDLVTLPDGSTGLIHDVTNSGKRRIAACASCAYEGRCLGIETSYLDEHGDGEFFPVPATSSVQDGAG